MIALLPLRTLPRGRGDHREWFSWLAFVSYADANPTPDRLSTLLSLAADAGLIAQDLVDDEFVYSVV